MRVTAITGVALERIANVARHAGDIVFAVELEVSVVREVGGFPAACSVALRTSFRDLGMKRILRFGMTADTVAGDGGIQESVVKRHWALARKKIGGMIRMTRSAVQFLQLGMESRSFWYLVDQVSRGCSYPNLRRHVADNAPGR